MGSGGRPFGRGSGADINEIEADAIRDAACRVLAGETLSSIVEEWNRRGLRTARGGPWRINSLSGLLVHRRLTVSPAILDEDTHARLVALHASRGKGPRRVTRRYLLTGFLRCGLCGASLRGMSRTPRPDLYVCPGPPHGGCSGTAVTADHTDATVRDLVLARLAEQGPTNATYRSEVAELRAELAALQGRLEDLAELWISGDITREEWLRLRRAITNRVEVIEGRIGGLDSLAALQRLADQASALALDWSSLGQSRQRSIIDAVVESVTVLPAVQPRTVFRPERLKPVWRA